MSELALAFDAVPERLPGVVVAVPIVFEEAPAVLGERDRMLARSSHPNRFDQSLFPQMAQVARARVERAIVLVPEIATGDHSECANSRKRARFGSAQRVLAIAVPHEFPTRSARQRKVTREGLARIECTA